jgi:hypothetical protein
MPSARFFMNKNGKFVIFPHPSQDSRGITGKARIDDIKAIRTVPVQSPMTKMSDPDRQKCP